MVGADLHRVLAAGDVAERQVHVAFQRPGLANGVNRRRGRLLEHPHRVVPSRSPERCAAGRLR